MAILLQRQKMKTLPISKIERLLYAGYCEEQEDGFELLIYFAKFEPLPMLKHLKTISGQANAGMLIPGIAAILGQCSDAFRNANYVILKDILKISQADELLMLSEFLKSKIFGRGLGSFNQKLIREVLEDWTKLDLETSLHIFPRELLSLVKIIHPRFSDPERGKIIKELFGQ